MKFKLLFAVFAALALLVGPLASAQAPSLIPGPQQTQQQQQPAGQQQPANPQQPQQQPEKTQEQLPFGQPGAPVPKSESDQKKTSAGDFNLDAFETEGKSLADCSKDLPGGGKMKLVVTKLDKQGDHDVQNIYILVSDLPKTKYQASLVFTGRDPSKNFVYDLQHDASQQQTELPQQQPGDAVPGVVQNAELEDKPVDHDEPEVLEHRFGHGFHGHRHRHWHHPYRHRHWHHPHRHWRHHHHRRHGYW